MESKFFPVCSKLLWTPMGFIRKKGIPDDIYFATMKCFPRFIDETYKMTGKLCFDRYWWTTRQAGCHLFRIGELEYELKHMEKDVIIGIHIPSDVDFSPLPVEKSLQDAYKFLQNIFLPRAVLSIVAILGFWMVS